MRLSRLRSLRSKKLNWFFITIALFILILGIYVLWSRQAWTQLTPHYTQWHQGLQAEVSSAAVLPATTAKEQDAVMAKLMGVSSKIDTDQRTVCTVHNLVQWQRKVISTFNDTYSACQKMVAATVDFQKQLTVVIAYHKNDQTLAGIIAAVPQAGELAEDTWEAQMIAWGDAAMTIEKMTATDSFKPTQQLAVEHATAIKAAWQDVIAAHQAKDKQKYLAAQGSLATAIDALNEVSLGSQQASMTLSGKLEKATQKAFI